MLKLWKVVYTLDDGYAFSPQEEIEIAEDEESAKLKVKIAVQSKHNDNLVLDMIATEITEIKGHRIKIEE